MSCGPQTFYFPINELDVAMPKPGEVGEITIKVEVLSVDKEGVQFEKHGPVRVTVDFKPMDLEELKNRIGTVDDEESPMHESTESKSERDAEGE